MMDMELIVSRLRAAPGGSAQDVPGVVALYRAAAMDARLEAWLAEGRPRRAPRRRGVDAQGRPVSEEFKQEVWDRWRADRDAFRAACVAQESELVPMVASLGGPTAGAGDDVRRWW